MSCPPSYSYRPTFIPSSTKCIAPFFHEHRSRRTAGGAFFRSIEQGPLTNLIAIEIDFFAAGTNPVNPSATAGNYLIVYYDTTPVESFGANLGCGGIASLRGAVNSGSDYIEMPAFEFDIFDPRDDEEDECPDDDGLSSFAFGYLKGGAGPPIDDAGLAAIRTGPERSIIILATTEDLDGSPITPPWFRRVQQWNGTDWVTHANLVQGICPFEGTS